MEFITLNNGVQIPQIGLGAAGLWYNKKWKAMLSETAIKQYLLYKNAVKKDYFLYDSSHSYGYHQQLLGHISKTKKNRENMFLCTKVSNWQQRKRDIRTSLQFTLDIFGVDYIDLYLLHWPQTDTFVDCYLQMEELYKEGKVKAIGVCNCHKHHIETLMEKATVIPAVNQFEIHPLLTQEPLIEYCRSLGITPMAYTPLARMHDVLIEAKPLRELSEKYNKTVPQIILRWDIQQGLITIPRTSNPKRLDEYLDVFDFSLSNEEMKSISDLNDNIRLRFNPDKCDFSIL